MCFSSRHLGRISSCEFSEFETEIVTNTPQRFVFKCARKYVMKLVCCSRKLTEPVVNELALSAAVNIFQIAVWA